MKHNEYNLNKFTKKEKEAIKNRKAYEKRLEKTSEKWKKEKIKEHRIEMAKMLNEGKAEKEIITALEISRRTYYSDKSVIISENLL
jgi:DNA-binding NarL/FixJ family response regulator